MGSANSVGNYLNRRFCEFREFCGKSSQQKVLCKSVKSVGEYLSRRFCVFREFCRRLLSAEGSVGSANSVGDFLCGCVEGVSKLPI